MYGAGEGRRAIKIRLEMKVGARPLSILNAVQRLFSNERSSILGFTGKMSLDMCLGKFSLVTMGRSEWRGQTEAETSQKQ